MIARLQDAERQLREALEDWRGLASVPRITAAQENTANLLGEAAATITRLEQARDEWRSTFGLQLTSGWLSPSDARQLIDRTWANQAKALREAHAALATSEQARTQLQQELNRAQQRWGNLKRRIKDEIIHFGEPHMPKQATAQHANGIARLRWVLHEMAKSPDVLQEAVSDREDESAVRLAQIEALRPRAVQLSSHLSWCKDIGVLTPTEGVAMWFLRDLLALLDAPQPQPQTEPT